VTEKIVRVVVKSNVKSRTGLRNSWCYICLSLRGCLISATWISSYL